jgi:hypothetical protein
MIVLLHRGSLELLGGSGMGSGEPDRSSGDDGSATTRASSRQEALRLFKRLGDTTWTQRRVEEISVIGRRLVQRKVWVIVKPDPYGDEKLAFLPLSRFGKKAGALERVFQVRNGEDAIVPALVPVERDERVVKAILTVIQDLLPGQPRPWLELQQKLVAAVREPDRRKVGGHVEELRELLRDADDKGVVDDSLIVLRILAEQRVLLVPVNVEKDSQPRCFSFDYISSDTFQRSEDDRQFFARFAARMGWRPATFGFPVPGAGLTRLFQVVFRAPEGVAISESEIRSPAGRDRGAGDSTVHQVDHASTGTARLEEEAEAVFCLRPHRVGLLRNGLIASIIISIMLIAGAVLMEKVKNAAAQADAAVALLLAAPSFFLLQAVQSYEHRVVSSMLKGLRWMVVAVGLAAFFAAVLLVTYTAAPDGSSNGRPETSDTPLHLLWCLLAMIAGLSTVGLAIAYLFGGHQSPGPDEQPASEEAQDASKLRGRRTVLTVLSLAFAAVGGLAWTMSLLVVAAITLTVLDLVALREPLAMPFEVAGCFLIGLVGLGIASLAVVPILRAARPSASDTAGNDETSATTGDALDRSQIENDSKLFQDAFKRLIDRLEPAPPPQQTDGE